MRNPDLAARDIESIASLIRENIQHETEKYSFLEVIVVDKFARNKKNCLEIDYPGIQKAHHFTLTNEGKILSRTLSCETCISVGHVCDVCEDTATCVYLPAVELDEEPEVHQPLQVSQDDEEQYCDLDDDEGLQDPNDNDSCLDPDEDDRVLEEVGGQHGEEWEDVFGPGDLVWVRRRKWVPGIIIDLDAVPQSTKRYVPSYSENQFIVQLFPPFNDVVVSHRTRIVALKENRQDRKFASFDESVHEAYNHAVASMNGDG